jgi:hypothetical protein
MIVPEAALVCGAFRCIGGIGGFRPNDDEVVVIKANVSAIFVLVAKLLALVQTEPGAEASAKI